MPADSLLTDDERSYFAAVEDTFNSLGWEYITKDLQTELEGLPVRAFREAKSYEELQAARAKAAAITEILSAPVGYEYAKASKIQGREYALDNGDE